MIITKCDKNFFAKHDRHYQGDFIRQEIWLTSVHLFEVHWNDHLVTYFFLMHHCEINKNLLPLTFSSRNILIIYNKILIITVICNETTNELTIYAKL